VVATVSNLEVLDNIPFKPDISTIMTRLRFHGNNLRFEKIVPELLDLVVPLARPKALYKISCLSRKTRDSLEIGGVKFTGWLLRLNLDRTDKVFPFAATCGQEVDSLRSATGDAEAHYCLEVIKEMILKTALHHLQNSLLERYGLDYLFSLSPGELQAWPLSQQKPLFSILGNVEGLIGVELTATCSLVPQNSAAGILYFTQTEFESCQLCSQEPCMGRRASFNPDLARKYGNTAQKHCGR
jgi:hypothetical protein